MPGPEKQKPPLKASPFGRGGIAQAMTERASPSPESRRTAISRFFGRAMLSLRLLFFVSVLALSGADAPAPPKGEPLACRSAFAWTLKARRGAKGRALLQRAGFPLYNLSVIADAMPPLLVGEALAVPAK